MVLIASEDQDPDTGLRSGRGGGKLSRSETVTVRLDPKLNYLCELAARAQRRTKSSYVEWAVGEAMAHTFIAGLADWNGTPTSIAELADRLWDVDESDRLAQLAFNAPTLMSHEEQVLWKAVCNYTFVWSGRWRSVNDTQEAWNYEIKSECLLRDRYREKFEDLKKVARGEASLEDLFASARYRQKKHTARPFDDDLDDFGPSPNDSADNDECPF